MIATFGHCEPLRPNIKNYTNVKIAGQKVHIPQTFATVLWVFPLECPKVEISLGFGEQIRDSPSNVPEMSGIPLI